MTLYFETPRPSTVRITGEGTDRWAVLIRRDRESWHLRRSNGVECAGEMPTMFAQRWAARWVAGELDE